MDSDSQSVLLFFRSKNKKSKFRKMRLTGCLQFIEVLTPHE